ncbi:OLC1v1006759C2 [Oldenlandia corymbosa var. corymbosa]|uniref:OLC1v1006759C2 n=2 Tax=Oldenlandia corymbosa var. corymbosa TaxID=529605 RepID=A0AAV1DHR9_OLDCO|nr:OLC1v1006759C2 [Oldenlandia corymbosa var. corymbosa]
MAARPHVPQFGKWENQDNVPYTMAFDKARKGRGAGGKMINPNDPQENPEMFANMRAGTAPPPARNRAQTPEANGRGGPVKPLQEPRMGREDYGNPPRQFAPSPSPARNENFGSRKTTPGDSVNQQHSSHGSHLGRQPRQSAGSEYSFERSPMHPVYQAKLGGRGSASPAWDGKNSINDSSHGASVAKSRMKQSTRVDESPDRSAAVPRFGDWDESNPEGGDYTGIFNKVREERNQTPSHDEGRRIPYRTSHRPNSDGHAKV